MPSRTGEPFRRGTRDSLTTFSSEQLREERRFGVFRVPNAMTASALTLLALVGAIVGVDLGRSTVAMINPAYYSSPPPGHYFADLTPAGYRPDLAANDPYQDSTSGADASLPSCLDCTVIADGRDGREEARPEEVWHPAEPLPLVIRGIPPGNLERYMDYPVTQDEARHQAERKPPRFVRNEAQESTENEAEAEPDGL